MRHIASVVSCRPGLTAVRKFVTKHCRQQLLLSVSWEYTVLCVYIAGRTQAHVYSTTCIHNDMDVVLSVACNTTSATSALNMLLQAI